MSLHRLPITSASFTLRFADGSTETYDIHEGARIGASLTADTQRPDHFWSDRRVVPVIDSLRVVIEASSGSADKLATRTATDGALGREGGQ